MNPTKSHSITKHNELKKCFRCGQQQKLGWEYSWPLYGKLTIGCASQIFHQLSGRYGENGNFCADERSFVLWNEIKTLPWFKLCEAQVVQIRWGEKVYLCEDCQHEFLALVGKFFIPKQLL